MAEQTVATSTKRWATFYETIYILRPGVDPEDADRVATRVKEVIDRLGARLTKVDVWGKRKLAYPIAKHTRGVFVYVAYVGYNDVVAEIERNLRLQDSVIRFQTVKLRDMMDLEAVQVTDEIEFTRIEVTEDEEEPTTAQRLGMVEGAPYRGDDEHRGPREVVPEDEEETVIGASDEEEQGDV